VVREEGAGMGTPVRASHHEVVQDAGACPPVLWRGVEAEAAGQAETAITGNVRMPWILCDSPVQVRPREIRQCARVARRRRQG
jgi:hypothetical protein